jgi:hypothetical protein
LVHGRGFGLRPVHVGVFDVAPVDFNLLHFDAALGQEGAERAIASIFRARATN